MINMKEYHKLYLWGTSDSDDERIDIQRYTKGLINIDKMIDYFEMMAGGLTPSLCKLREEE